jgi:hypothetical protein
MPSWKKVITSGSAAAFSSLIVSSTITGSLSGSLTGSLQGTASWATNALTASYILSSNVYGPSGFDSINYASSAGSAGTAINADTASVIASPLTQDLTINGIVNINGSFNKNISSPNLNTLISIAYNEGADDGLGKAYSGEILIANRGIPGFDIDTNVPPTLGDLLSLDVDGTWRITNQTSNSSTTMLGFYIQDPTTSTEGILIDGCIVLPRSTINTVRFGVPLFITGSGPVTYTTDPTTIVDPGYIRNIGHLQYSDENNYPNWWVLRFKPSNDWTQII